MLSSKDEEIDRLKGRGTPNVIQIDRSNSKLTSRTLETETGDGSDLDSRR